MLPSIFFNHFCFKLKEKTFLEGHSLIHVLNQQLHGITLLHHSVYLKNILQYCRKSFYFKMILNVFQC